MKKLILLIAMSMLVLSGLCAENPVAFQQTYPVSAISGVKLDLMSEDVQIALWNKDEFRVTVVSGYTDYPVPYVRNGVLCCDNQTGGSRHSCLVEIKVPESFFAKAGSGGWTVSTMSGSITADKLWGESVSITSSSGTITLSKCEAGMLTAESMSGRITCTQGVISGRTSLETSSGEISFIGLTGGLAADTISGSINVTLDQPLNQDCNLSSVSGGILLSMPENTGFKLVFDTLSGQMYNAFTGYVGGKSGIDTYGSGYVVVTASTTSGAIRILKR